MMIDRGSVPLRTARARATRLRRVSPPRFSTASILMGQPNAFDRAADAASTAFLRVKGRKSVMTCSLPKASTVLLGSDPRSFLRAASPGYLTPAGFVTKLKKTACSFVRPGGQNAQYD